MAERSTFLSMIGYLGALAFGAYEIQRDSDLPIAAASKGAPQIIPSIEMPPDVIKNIAAFDTITERPLFNPNRLLSSKTTASAPTRPIAPAEGVENMRLAAVLKGPDILTILLEDRAGKTRIMHTGEEIGKWRIEEILDDRIVIASGDRRETLLVHRFDPVIPNRLQGRRSSSMARRLRQAPEHQRSPQPSITDQRPDNTQDNP